MSIEEKLAKEFCEELTKLTKKYGHKDFFYSALDPCNNLINTSNGKDDDISNVLLNTFDREDYEEVRDNILYALPKLNSEVDKDCSALKDFATNLNNFLRESKINTCFAIATPDDGTMTGFAKGDGNLISNCITSFLAQDTHQDLAKMIRDNLNRINLEPVDTKNLN